MSAFFIFKEEFKKEFNNNSGNMKFTFAAGERWKLLSDSDKAPYVLKAQKLKGKMSVENDKEDEFDKSMADKSEFDRSESVKSECGVVDDHEQGSNSLKGKAPYVLKAQKLKGKRMSVENDNEDEFEEFDKSMADKSEFNKSESVKSECGVGDDHEQGSNSLKVNGDNIKTEIDEGEDELKNIIMDFARFEEALMPVKLVAPPKATNLYKHLDELEKLIALPLETLLESANLIQLRNILKLVKDLPLANPKLCEWCNTLLEVTMVMPEHRIGIQKVLIETEAKAKTMVQLHKEAADIRKTTLIELQRKEEYSTCIKRVDAKIESLKSQLVEAEAERAMFIQLEDDLAASNHQRLKRARIVRDDFALLIEQNAAINKIILDSKNAIKNIDCHLNALIVQFNVLKNAA